MRYNRTIALLAALATCALAIIACSGVSQLITANSQPTATSAAAQPTQLSSSRPASASATPTTAAPAANPTPKPNPLTVSVALDTKHVASARIEPEGGTISVAAADGTKFTLTMPKDALLSEETITMTVVSAVNGLPLKGGLTASVQLAPEGLELFEPATLTVTLPTATDPKESVGFAYSSTGKDFHLYPLEISGTTMTFELLHFSGYGAGQGNASDASQYTPTSAEAQAENEMGAALAECRASGQACTLDNAKTEQIMRDWYNDAVQPQLSAAETDDTVLDDALVEYFQWARQLMLLGIDESKFSKENQAALNSIVIGLKNAIDKAYDRCVNNHDPSQVVVMIRRAKLAAMLGLDNRPGLDMNSAVEKVFKCATFELDLDSTIEEETAAGPVRSHVRAKVPLTIDPSTGLWTWFSGKGSLDFVSIDWPQPNPNCNLSAVGHPSTIDVLARFDLNIQANAHPEIIAMINPNKPNATMTMTCKGVSRSFQLDIWAPGWSILHKDELSCGGAVGPGCGFVIRDWVVLGGSIYATKPYQRSANAGKAQISETTTLDLKHTPR